MKPARDKETSSHKRKCKAPYRKPQILSREKLEMIAAVCSPGKATGQGGDCFINANS